MVAPMTAAEMLSEFDVFAVGFELDPCITMEMALRQDFLWRREAGLRAVQDWPDVDPLLRLEAHFAQHELDWEEEEQMRIVENAQGAWASWP